MRKLLTTAILLVACAVSMGQTHGSGGLRPGVQAGQFKTLAEQNTNAIATLPNATPGIVMRFDDGTANQYLDSHIQYTMSQGLDVTLAIDPALIESGTGLRDGKMTWTQLRDLQSQAATYGVELDIWCHVEFDTVTVDDTYAEFQTRMDPTMIVDSLGVQPSTFLLGGTDDSKETATPRLTILRQIAIDYGYTYAIFTGTNQDELNSFGGFYPDDPSGTVGPNIASYKNGIRPGQVIDPYDMQGAGISDFTDAVVERSSSPTGVLDFLLSDEPTYSVDIASQWQKSWWYYLGYSLGGNLWFSVVQHDSTRANARSFTIGTNTQVWDRHWSPMHVAYTIKQLVDGGYAQTVTGTEFNNAMMRYYAPGTDLINNRDFTIPQYAVGDSFGVEYPIPQGMGTSGWAKSFWSDFRSLCPMGRFEDDMGTNGKPYRGGSDHPADLTGQAAGLAGDGAFGQDGAMLARRLSQNLNDRHFWSWGGLRPGHYEFSVWITGSFGSSAICTQKEAWIAASRIGYLTSRNAVSKLQYSTNDTLVVYLNETADALVGMQSGGASTLNDTKLVYYFTVPDTGPEHTSTTTYWGTNAPTATGGKFSEQTWKTDWSWTIGLVLYYNGNNVYLSDAKLIYNPLRR